LLIFAPLTSAYANLLSRAKLLKLTF